MKGKTKIILTNVETGEQEIHEDENLVTHAIDKIINLAMAMNQQPNSYLLPIATKLLGGIMLFDDTLTEDADNIHFPTSQAHLVGYADQNTNTSDAHRGSYNAQESGKTATGFVSTWDFGTNQANGVIKSVARTHYIGGANPLRYFWTRFISQTNNGAPDTDLSWFPIRYDGTYLYMLKGNSSTHQMRLARVKIPMMGMGVADYSDVARTYEVVASWDTTVFTYTYYTNRGTSSERAYDVTVYADDPWDYEDGQDGYIYTMWNGVTSGRDTDYNYDLNYFTIKYSDESYTKSSTQRAAVGTGDYSYNDAGRHPARYYGHVCKGVYYRLGATRKTIHIIPLSNPASFSTIRIISDDSPDYIDNLLRVCPHEGGVYYVIYHYLSTGTEWNNGILYPDGVYLTLEIPGENNNGTSNWWPYLTDCADDLIVFTATAWYTSSYNHNIGRDWATNYLGTINNLSSAVTKTAAQTMKIVYTLTDVDE